MHDNNNIQSKIRIIYAMVMGVIYIAIGILLLVNFFEWADTSFWKIARILVGAILIAYGIFRGYRGLIYNQND